MPAQVTIGLTFVGIISQVAWTATAHGAWGIKPLLFGIKLLLLGLNSLP